MARHLEGKTAIVTGGAGGIGSWISKLYAENGAKVIVADTGADVEGRMGLDPSRVNAVVDEITAAGGEAVAAIGDVSEMDVGGGARAHGAGALGQARHPLLRPRHPARADDLQHDRGRVGRLREVAPEGVLRADQVCLHPLAAGAAGRARHLLHLGGGHSRQQRASRTTRRRTQAKTRADAGELRAGAESATA